MPFKKSDPEAERFYAADESTEVYREDAPSLRDRLVRFFESLFGSAVDIALILAAVIVLVVWWWLVYELDLFP